jgi:DinB superfamily
MENNNEISNIYPIGKFQEPVEFTLQMRREFMNRLDTFPLRLAETVAHLKEMDLDKKYRPGGWKVRQIIHHLCDSHINAYTRFKLALTEDNPTIKPYDENKWSALEEVNSTHITVSVQLLTFLHQRWVQTIREMKPEEYERAYIHPQYQKLTSLDVALALYAWHSDHHLEQIKVALKIG